MSRITTVIISLSDHDRNRPGIHCLPAMVSNFLGDQFELDVAIRIEDERGETISETVPFSAKVVEVESAANVTLTGTLAPEPERWGYPLPPEIAGLIGN